MDDSATQSLHGGGEGATGSGTGLVEHGRQHFALYVKVSDIRGDMPFVFFTHPVNVPDLIQKHFGYGQLWPLQPACSQNRPGSCMPDLTSCICFSSIFPKKAWIMLCKTDPDPIWMAWSGFGQTHLVRKQAGVQESSGPVSGRTQPARYQFPTFRLGSVLPQTSRMIVCKTSLDPIQFWLIVSGFGQTDPVRKQAGVQESSGPLLASASQPVRTGSDPACLLGSDHLNLCDVTTRLTH